MADDRWSTWQAEYAGTNRLPPISLVFLVFGTLALVLILAIGPERLDRAANDGKPPTLCAEHAGRPGWAEVCARHTAKP